GPAAASPRRWRGVSVNASGRHCRKRGQDPCNADVSPYFMEGAKGSCPLFLQSPRARAFASCWMLPCFSELARSFAIGIIGLWRSDRHKRARADRFPFGASGVAVFGHEYAVIGTAWHRGNEKKECRMFKGFRDFILRGNVVDLAVAVVMGAAFGVVVNSVVKNVMTPLIGLAGGAPDFSAIRTGPLMWGNLINDILTFL